MLERSLTLPALPPADLAQAVQLEVAALTPFKLEQTVFGYRVQPATADRVRVDLALTSRQHMDVLLLQNARISRLPSMSCLKSKIEVVKIGRAHV